jgi:hypothetical protein
MNRGDWPMRWHHRPLFCGRLLLACSSGVRAAEPIAPEQFARLQGLIKPQAQEDAWAQIPWMTNLWEARQKAAAQGKPILLWEMDGHPLGCT